MSSLTPNASSLPDESAQRDTVQGRGHNEAEIQSVFSELLENLPDDFKYVLLLQALETSGPSCLTGLEAARDAILYAASRQNPELLKEITLFVQTGGASMSAGVPGNDEDYGDDDNDEADEDGDDHVGDDNEDDESGDDDMQRAQPAPGEESDELDDADGGEDDDGMDFEAYASSAAMASSGRGRGMMLASRGASHAVDEGGDDSSEELEDAGNDDDGGGSGQPPSYGADAAGRRQPSVPPGHTFESALARLRQNAAAAASSPEL